MSIFQDLIEELKDENLLEKGEEESNASEIKTENDSDSIIEVKGGETVESIKDKPFFDAGLPAIEIMESGLRVIDKGQENEEDIETEQPIESVIAESIEKDSLEQKVESEELEVAANEVPKDSPVEEESAEGEEAEQAEIKLQTDTGFEIVTVLTPVILDSEEAPNNERAIVEEVPDKNEEYSATDKSIEFPSDLPALSEHDLAMLEEPMTTVGKVVLDPIDDSDSTSEEEAESLDVSVVAAEVLRKPIESEKVDQDIEEPQSSLMDELDPVVEPAGGEIDEKEVEELADETAEEEVEEVPTEKELKIRYSQSMVDEISCLEVVEFILSAVEREQLRIAPSSYDTVPIKQERKKFLDVVENSDGPLSPEAGKALRKEIERWNSVLLERDSGISTTALRRFCEDNHLSSKVLVALARFYRNLTFSEIVRSKFDLIVTRLFSRDLPNSKREMAFERDDLIVSLNELYSEWSSIPVYADSNEDSELILAAFKFEDFIEEAKKAHSIDELLTSGYFKRLKSFKRKTGENFFSPLLVASAIECNISVGNQYVSLIAKEKKRKENKKIGERFGQSHDRSVSEATSKSLMLVELLNEKEKAKATKKASKKDKGKQGKKKKGEDSETSGKSNVRLLKVIIPILILIGIAIGVYFYASSSSASVYGYYSVEAQIKLENGALKDYVSTGSIEDQSFNGVVTSRWHSLPGKTKQEIIGKIFRVGTANGFSRVVLKNDSDEIVAQTKGSEIEILN